MMNTHIDETREYLLQYQQAAKDIERLRKIIETLDEEFDCIPSVTDYDGMPHGSNIGHPTEEKAIKAADRRRELEWEIVKLEDLQLNIIGSIAGVESPYGDVLLYRYIKGYTISCIASEMCYSETHIKRLHYEALKKVDLT